ncbi:hypothetical protein BCV70DRAFT_201180 [Testicularia cyperi]|uniref:ATP-dependent RNA helicase SUV3, mitochondrial n=1 Tax=Testicularia cyperi TaxID=1882483 RepID=A0A317XMD7_9BASI|nr:hypothetical protein BCV70DRAFT_201180 [Testicularia cyperi]
MLSRGISLAAASATSCAKTSSHALAGTRHAAALIGRTTSLSKAVVPSYATSRSMASTSVCYRGQSSFKSSDRSRSGSKSSSYPRRQETDAQRLKREKRDFFMKRAQERREHVFEGFHLPTPPTGQEVARSLVQQITALSDTTPAKGSDRSASGQTPASSSDGSLHLPARLTSYGLKGRALELLLQHEQPRLNSTQGNKEHPRTTSRADTARRDEANAARLFSIWAQEAYDLIPHLGLRYDAKREGKGTDTNGSNVSSRKKLAFSGIGDVVSSYTIEGESCLSRFCMSAFLDWVESGLEGLLQSSTMTSAEQGVTGEDATEIALVLSRLRSLRSLVDMRLPVHRYATARTLIRQIHLHVGPTNSGKTHGALVALSKAKTGVFAGPLRLLAHEVWDRFNSGTISPGVAPRACNLVTGEEQRTVDVNAGLSSCTVEMASLSRGVDVAVVDEIQMIGDPQRGYAWTDAVLGLPAKEIHLCGEASTIPLIRRIAEACGDELTVHEYQRLTPLTIADESINDDLSKIRTGDCIVAFSRSGIFELKREIEQKTGLRCAVAYGALPPETKAEQAKLFNEGKLDVMVASDAIGMGLNLKIKRVIFDTMSKWNGREQVTLSASQIKQIAGRAGRYGTKRADNQPDGGIVTTRHEDELEILQQALESPLNPVDRAAIQPRSESIAAMAAMLPPLNPARTAASRSDHDDKFSGGANITTPPSAAKKNFRTLSEIYTDVSLLSRIDSSTYFVSDFSQQHTISPVVESASRSLLTVVEREKFANAPANTRDERLMAFLSACVADFSTGGLVRFDHCAAGLGMLEVETASLDAMDEASRCKLRQFPDRYEGEDKAGKSKTTEQQPLAAYLGPNHELLNSSTLMLLESLHRSMSLYLWLSFRFPLAFCYRLDMDARKKRVEDAIEFVLEGIRFGRARRLRALGRTDEAERIFTKPTWKRQREAGRAEAP